MLQEMETNPELFFDSQQYLYRSGIVHSKDKLNGEYPFFEFGKDGSFVAPSEYTKETSEELDEAVLQPHSKRRPVCIA